MRQSRQAEYKFGFTGWKQPERGSVMECRNKVHFPASGNAHGAITPGNEVKISAWRTQPICTFQLRGFEEIYFYECLHCENAGCPSFDYVEGRSIPEDVYEYMKLHAELCSKLER